MRPRHCVYGLSVRLCVHAGVRLRRGICQLTCYQLLVFTIQLKHILLRPYSGCFIYYIFVCTNTHTHPFNGPFSGTTRVSQYQKGKTNLDFTDARDSEWQWHQLGHMQVCTLLQTDNQASTPPLSFLQAGCPSCHPTNSVKALKGNIRAQSTIPNTSRLVITCKGATHPKAYIAVSPQIHCSPSS